MAYSNMMPSSLKVNNCYQIDASKVSYSIYSYKFLATYEGSMGTSSTLYNFKQEGDIYFPMLTLTLIDILEAVSYINLDEIVS
jgi:hypothetical protein